MAQTIQPWDQVLVNVALQKKSFFLSPIDDSCFLFIDSATMEQKIFELALCRLILGVAIFFLVDQINKLYAFDVICWTW